MTKLVIILTMIIILLLLYLYLIIVKKEEGFQVDLKPTTIKSYNDFLSFYNTFCSNWQKSIKSAVASQIPQKPLTDPSQVTSSDAPDIPESDMNNYISLLSQQLLKPLPSICKKLPSQLNSNSLVRIIKEVPKSTRPFINAINWMNSQLEQSQANLGPALQGISPLESFEDMCDNVSACIENNPELAKKVAVNIAEQQKKEQETQEEQLLKAINPFLTEPELRRTYDKNIMLFKQAEEIQTKAESGQLLNQMSIQDNDIDIKYTKPPGANNLNNMKQNDPARYNEVQTNYKQLFSIKKLIDQINSNIK
jgi:hypothetical protein